VGLGGLEPPTSRLSGVRSNQLSYRPKYLHDRGRIRAGGRNRVPGIALVAGSCGASAWPSCGGTIRAAAMAAALTPGPALQKERMNSARI
jgi:hypothetical protein